MSGMSKLEPLIIVQGSSAPVFCGPTGPQFLCKLCGHVLVNGYDPRSLIAIDIKCFKCSHITKTDSWPDDEPLPNLLISLGNLGSILISKTVDVKDKVALSTDHEIARVRGATAPKPADSKIELSLNELNAIEVELIAVTGGAFEKARASCMRAQAAGNRKFAEDKFPAIWALDQLKRALGTGQIDISGADGISLAYLQIVRDCLGRWRHHPLFSTIARSLCQESEFHHSVTTFIVASYLSDFGNRVGITNAAKQLGRSPDLFINVDRDQTLSIEVKCPKAFFWSQELPPRTHMLRKVTKELREARGQITGKAGGVVVIGAGQISGNFEDDFKACLNETVSGGRASGRIAAVVGVSYRPTQVASDGILEASAEIFLILNPKYEGKNPIIINGSS